MIEKIDKIKGLFGDIDSILEEMAATILANDVKLGNMIRERTNETLPQLAMNIVNDANRETIREMEKSGQITEKKSLFANLRKTIEGAILDIETSNLGGATFLMRRALSEIDKLE